MAQIAEDVFGEGGVEFANRVVSGGKTALLAEHQTILKEAFTINEFSRPINKKRNAFRNVALFDKTRVHLKTPHSMDYIHASRVLFGQYILTQAPMNETIEDYWRLVAQEHVGVIVCFMSDAEGGRSGDDRFPFWPTDNTLKFSSKLGRSRIEVKLKQKEKGLDFERFDLQLKLKEEKEPHHLVLLQYTNWMEQLPPNNILKFMEIAWEHNETLWRSRGVKEPPGAGKRQQVVPESSQPILVTCADGCRKSGTFAALSGCCRLQKVTGKTSVREVVRRIQRDRYGSLQSESAYYFIYQKLVEWAISKKELSADDPVVKKFLNSFLTPKPKDLKQASRRSPIGRQFK